MCWWLVTIKSSCKALSVGVICRYHRFTIKETLDKFVLTTHSPGEPQDVQEMAHAAFRPELKRWALHEVQEM